MRYSILVSALGALAIALAGCPDKKPKYPSCNGDKDCQEGEHCIAKKCVQCGDDSHCEAGQECKDGACVAREGWCETDADCPDHKICKNNQCIACVSDDECVGGKCTDGACLRPGECVKDEDCADDEDCIDGKCTNMGLGSGDGGDMSCQLATVYFDFDASSIREDSRGVLEANAQCLQETTRNVYIVGHTDPRGTDEYNIALSDGRARAVADFLARLGIDPARFHIVPKGESDAQGEDESTWVQDRKVTFEWQ